MVIYDRHIKSGLVALYDTGQETERVYSYNPGAYTELVVANPVFHTAEVTMEME